MSSHQLDEERIFHLARQIPGQSARSEYLEQVCAGDQALRDRVEALLEVHEQEQSFLKSARPSDIEETRDHSPVLERPGRTIGRYKLMEQIGEGGMGTVFVAEQAKPLRRKVALKVIKPGMDTKAVIARFEAERQALALMDHPNIAKVLDAGTTESGRPFFVMELVKGQPITEYCDEKKLTIGERLELFIQVCRAIQHAHQKGVIHRDIKPSNVLVTEQDGKAIPKVIDFGVAKALHQSLTDRTVYTSFQSVIGTPLYMSPEQAKLSAVDVDTRSDVYSLGVLLYELLVGVTPFEKERLAQLALDEACRVIREEDPPRPSGRIGSLGDTATTVSADRSSDPTQLTRLVRGDLDWIVMKALDKDRGRRYESASGFSHDVARFLENKPVEARSPTWTYRARKFLLRNKASVAVAVLLATSLSLGLASSLYQAHRIRLALNRLRESKQEQLAEAMEHTTIRALQGDLVAATAQLQRAEDLGADRAWVVLRRGQIALQAGEYDEAKEWLEKARSLAPDSTPAFALPLICEYYAGYEHAYLLGLRELQKKPANSFDDYLFRGLANTWANPDQAVEDLKEAISRNSKHAVVHLLLANALRLKAADTTDTKLAYEIATSATQQAFVAKDMLRDNPFAAAEYIQANIVLANICKKLGEDYSSDHDRCIERADAAVADLDARQLPYNWMTHLARVYLREQYGNRDQERAELFRTVRHPDGQQRENDNDIVLRRAMWQFREHKYDSAMAEFASLDGTFAYRTNLMFPAMIEASATSSDGLQELQDRYRRRLSDSRRDKEGVFAHHDWSLARLLQLDDVATVRGKAFLELIPKLGLDTIDDYKPLAKYMGGDHSAAPEVGLPERTNSNRVLAETYFALGVDRLAQGRRAEAKEYFQRCVDTGYYEFFVYWWSKAFMEKIDDPSWLPWLSIKD